MSMVYFVAAVMLAFSILPLVGGKRTDCEDDLGYRGKGGLDCGRLADVGACDWLRVANACPKSCGLCTIRGGRLRLGAAELGDVRAAMRAKADPAFAACCVAKNLPATCSAMCHYGVTAGEMVEKAPLCLAYASKLLSCATFGRDASDCCKFRGVSDQCSRAFCDGAWVGQSDQRVGVEQAVCLSFARPMLACHLHGTVRDMGGL